MKKLTSISIVLLFSALVFSSCKKDWTCSCSVTWTNSALFVSGDTTFTSSTPINDKSKGDAKDACDAGDGSQDDGFGGTVASNCDID